MEKKPSKRQQHKLMRNPYVAAILVLLWAVLFTNIITAFNFLGTNSFKYILSVISGILLMVIHRAWFKEEYDGSFTKSGLQHKDINIITLLALIATFLIVILPAWLQSGVNPPSIEALLHGASAGVFEEAMSRALMISVMMRIFSETKDVKKPVIFTAVAFGLVHLFNIIGGAAVGATLVQVVSAGAGGVFFAAIFLRTGNVLLPIVFHSLYDMMSFMQKGSESGIMTGLTTLEAVTSIIHAVLLIAVSIYLLRSHEEEIIELWNTKWNKKARAGQAETAKEV